MSSYAPMLSVWFMLLGSGFPIIALVARRRSQRALWVVTGVASIVAVCVGLVLATSWAGNRLVETEGYARVASGTLRMALFIWVFPIATTAFALTLLGDRVSQWFAYPVAYGATLTALIVGMILMLWVSY